MSPLRVLDLPLLERAFIPWAASHQPRNPNFVMPECIVPGRPLVSEVDATLLQDDGRDLLHCLAKLVDVPRRLSQPSGDLLRDVVTVMTQDAMRLHRTYKPRKDDPAHMFKVLSRGTLIPALLGRLGKVMLDKAAEPAPEEDVSTFQP